MAAEKELKERERDRDECREKGGRRTAGRHTAQHSIALFLLLREEAGMSVSHSPVLDPVGLSLPPPPSSRQVVKSEVRKHFSTTAPMVHTILYTSFPFVPMCM